MLVSEQEGIVKVFKAFNYEANMPFPYPEDNIYPFEEWYYENFLPQDIRERIYLPIFWTGYYVRANYGKDKSQIDHLQGYLNVLDRTRKYYTIVQYDDGILNDLTGLDIRVYSMSGKPMDYPLPLICQPHNFNFGKLDREFKFSFVGRLTHPVRQEIVNAFEHTFGFYVTSRHHSLEEYCRILARSVCVLCPRGYGPTSFRICEALQFGAIPIYISDEPIYPHNASFPGATLSCGHVGAIEQLIEQIRELKMAEAMERYIADCYQNSYTYTANKRLILQDLLNQNNKL